MRRVREGLERETEEARNGLFGVMTQAHRDPQQRPRKGKADSENVRHAGCGGSRRRRTVTEKLRALEEKLTTVQERAARERDEKNRLETEERELTDRIDGADPGVAGAAKQRGQAEGAQERARKTSSNR